MNKEWTGKKWCVFQNISANSTSSSSSSCTPLILPLPPLIRFPLFTLPPSPTTTDAPVSPLLHTVPVNVVKYENDEHEKEGKKALPNFQDGT